MNVPSGVTVTFGCNRFFSPLPLLSLSLGSQICAFYTSAVVTEEMQILTARRGEKRCSGTAGMSTADHMPIR